MNYFINKEFLHDVFKYSCSSPAEAITSLLYLFNILLFK